MQNIKEWLKLGIWKSISQGITGLFLIFLLLVLLLFLYGGYYMLGTGRDVSPYNDAYALHNQLWAYVYDNGCFPKDEEALSKGTSNLLPNQRSGYPKRKRWRYRLISENEKETVYLLVIDDSRDLFKVLTYYGAEVTILGRAQIIDGKWVDKAELFCRGEITNREFTYLQKQ